MSKFKFKSIKSYSKVIRKVKRDLWGHIILNNNNKFKRIFTKLYGKKRRYISKILKHNFIKNYFKISNGKIINKKYFGVYLVKKARKKKVNKLKKILNRNFTIFNNLFENTEKIINQNKILDSKIQLLKKVTSLTFDSNEQFNISKVGNLNQKVLKNNQILLNNQNKIEKLKKFIKKILLKLKKSFYFKKLENKRKKSKKMSIKIKAAIDKIKPKHVTDDQKLVYFIETLKQKKKNYKLHVKIKKKKLLARLKKKKEDLIKKLGEKNIVSINNLIRDELIRYTNLFKVDRILNSRADDPIRKLPSVVKIQKKINLLFKETKKKNLTKKEKLILNLKLSKLRKRRRNQIIIEQYYIYKENYKKTEDYKNRFDFETLQKKKYDNSYFLKKYKNFFSNLVRSRFQKNYYDLNTGRFKKRRQFKSILNLAYIKVYKKKVKTTKFGKALNQKQTLKRYLGNLSSKKLKKLYLFFKNKKIKKERYNFFLNLESTLFYTLIRAKLFTNYIYLSHIIKHGYVLVNNKPIFDKFYRLKPFDKITFDKTKIKRLKIRFLSFDVSKMTRPISNLIVSYSTYSIIFLKYPNLNELSYNFKISYNIFKSIYKKY